MRMFFRLQRIVNKRGHSGNKQISGYFTLLTLNIKESVMSNERMLIISQSLLQTF